MTNVKIKVTFSRVDIAVGRAMSRLEFPSGGDHLYVLLFDDGRRMLANVSGSRDFDSAFLKSVGLFDGCGAIVNPCGADLIEEAGLDPLSFDTVYEGGLFRVESWDDADKVGGGARQVEGRRLLNQR